LCPAETGPDYPTDNSSKQVSVPDSGGRILRTGRTTTI
jgi:hypothetical protein